MCLSVQEGEYSGLRSPNILLSVLDPISLVPSLPQYHLLTLEMADPVSIKKEKKKTTLKKLLFPSSIRSLCITKFVPPGGAEAKTASDSGTRDCNQPTPFQVQICTQTLVTCCLLKIPYKSRSLSM